MGDYLIPADTTPEAAEVYFEVLRNLGPARRLRMVFELSKTMRAAYEAGVRHRHPDYDDESVRLAVLRLMVGEELLRQIHPDLEIQP